MQNSTWRRRLLFAFCIVNVALTLAACGARPLVALPAAAPVASEPAADAGQQLAAVITAAINGPGVARGTWGIAVHSLSRSERLAEHNAHRLLVPASSAKLISLAAAVDAVGWDHTFETTLVAMGPTVDGVVRGDLIVVG